MLRVLPSSVVVGWEQGVNAWPSPGSRCPSPDERNWPAEQGVRAPSEGPRGGSDLDQVALQGEATSLPLLKLF